MASSWRIGMGFCAVAVAATVANAAAAYRIVIIDIS
jgi:hypothetical protein